jgi:hypothetical protein
MEDGEVGEVTPMPLKSSVCDIKKWDITPDAKDLDVQVVRTETGATVFTVPKDGGAVRGFRLDQRGDLFDRDMLTLRDDRNYTGVSASIAGDRLIVASVVGDTVAIDMVRDDLGARHGLGEVSGTLEAPVVTSRANHLALVGGREGLVANGFALQTWESTGPFTVTKDPIVSITAAPYFSDTILAWSTENKTCHLQRFGGKKESVGQFACNDARIAMNEADLYGQLVFVEDGTLYRSDILIGRPSELGGKIRIAENASSPRVVFDGTRFWISYINAHGDVVAGFLDKGRLASRALEGMRPSPEAYDLAVFSDGPWLVDVHATAFAAVRMCAKQ